MQITNYVVGIAAGLVIALILTVIMKYTIFKGKSMSAFYMLIFMLFAISGGYIQKSYFTVSAEAMPTPQEQIETLEKEITDGWKNTNGGFTFEQIIKVQEDSNAPTYDDQIIDLKCHDFGSYVVFSYLKGDIHQNAVFYKSNNGLILDGVINMHVSMTGVKWFYAYDLDTFKWVDNRDKAPSFEKTYVPINWDVINGKYDNLLSLSRQSVEFLQYNYKFRTNKNEMTSYVMKNIANLTGQNVTSNFIKFGNVELIGTANTGFIKINSFYNYLYQQIKGQNYNTTKLIDGSSSLCLPIPTALQTNYPISASKKAEYDNADYYGVYRTNIAVNLTFVKGNTSINSTVKNEEYLDTLENDDKTKDKIQVETITNNYTFTKVKVNFKDSKISDLTQVNLLTKPIRIQFNSNEFNTNKIVTIDSLSKLNNGLDVLLHSNTTWTYYIDSQQLIFDDFQGSFLLKETSSSITFDYYYLDNFTIVSVGLNPIGTIDTNLIDLQTNPVRIVLSNTTKSYQFLFNSNAQLDKYESMLLELGDYDYTILSSQLLFASVTGKLTITNTDKTMLFNYALNVDTDALKFDIDISIIGTTNNRFSLYSDASNVTLIRETLSSNKVYLVTCVIYDADGRLMETFTHTHSVTGTCSDTWTASKLVPGQNYTLQLRFTDRDDTSITYLSDITDFTFQSNTNYRVTYHVTKN
jgi:hypothetical protein